MGNFFGVRRRAPIVTSQDRAILQLKQQRDKIKIYQKRTEKELAINKELAIRLFQNNMKERALVVLRRKKCMEDILSKTDTQLSTLEQLVNDIEYTQIEVSVVEGLKVGTEALKQLNNLMNIDDIQQMMEDNEEAAEKQREISDILQRSAVRYDEDDLLKELDDYANVDRHKEKPIEIEGDQDPQETVTEDKSDIPMVAGENISENDEVTVQDKLKDLPNVPEKIAEDIDNKDKKVIVKKKSNRELEPAQ